MSSHQQMPKQPDAGQASLFIIAAASGAGKTTLVRALLNQLPDLAVSISTTTRDRRPGEQDGVDYHFVGKPVFQSMVAENRFLEYAEVFDQFYGTSRDTVASQLAQGRDVVLEIDWQGAQQVRASQPDSVGIYILPPSRQALEQRLRSRAQDSEQQIQRRMRDAISEMSHFDEFDYMVVNDDFDQALRQLSCIIQSQRLRTRRQNAVHQNMISELLGLET